MNFITATHSPWVGTAAVLPVREETTSLSIITVRCLVRAHNPLFTIFKVQCWLLLEPGNLHHVRARMVATGMRDIADRTHGTAMLLVFATDPLGLGAASIHAPWQKAAGLFVGAERSIVGAQLHLGFDEPHFVDDLFLCLFFVSVPVCEESVGSDASVVLDVAHRLLRTAVHLVGTAHCFW